MWEKALMNGINAAIKKKGLVVLAYPFCHVRIHRKYHL
jgi:hypothetical protein